MTYEPVSLGLKFSIRIHDLTARDVVVVTCTGCHAKFNVAPHHLHARYHEFKKLLEVEKDFKCKRCGATEGLRWHIMRAVGPRYPAGV